MSIESDYKDALALRAAAEVANRHAAKAEEPFVEIAWKIAREIEPLADGNLIEFKEDKVVFSCTGTGIHSDEQWSDEFKVEMLFERMREAQGRRES